MATPRFDASKFFATSDIHFFHDNIIRYCSRPFNGVSDMHETFIMNWNAKVPRDSDVFIVGDVAMGGKGKAQAVADMLDELHGRKYLIKGNHDNYVLKEPCSSKFQWIKDYAEVRINAPGTEHDNRKLVMFHFPIQSWNDMHNGSWHLFGHQHHTAPPDFTRFAIDVGIDYSPLSFDDVVNLMSMRKFVPVDHHGAD
jgi:calcineurin-like phosphoesterase family protein